MRWWEPFLQVARWLKSAQNPWWERICINVLCTEARLVLFWLCSWDIYEVPDAHYTSLMRNNPGKCWFSCLLQCTGLPIMELKLPGNYDWIGFAIFCLPVFFVSFIFSVAAPMHLQMMCAKMCIYWKLVLIFKMMPRGRGESWLWGFLQPDPLGWAESFMGVSHKWAAWDSIKGSKWNVKLLLQETPRKCKVEERRRGASQLLLLAWKIIRNVKKPHSIKNNLPLAAFSLRLI